MYKYYMPAKVYWGKGSLSGISQELVSLGKKPLIVTGRNSADLSGALPDLRNILNKQNVNYTLFQEIGENPELEIIHKGAELFRKSRCDFLIGIGGGSPIDAAKAISVIAANNLKGREIYQTEKLKKAYPVIAVPTTSGTGTEVTPYSVISDQELKKKAGFGNPLIFPVISFCDPEYTFSLPERVTIDTALDAMSHLLEGIYSRNRCDFLFPMIIKGIKDIIRCLPQVIEEPDNYQLRETLMKASLYGGIVIAQGGTTLQHSIGYPLTTHYGLSHGMANGIVMKDIMDMFSSEAEKELNMLFSHPEFSRAEFDKWIEQWISKSKLSLPDDFIDRAAEEIMQSRNMAQNPREVSPEEVKSILKRL